MRATPLHTLTVSREVTDLAGDPDSCTVKIQPTPNVQLKHKQGGIVFVLRYTGDPDGTGVRGIQRTISVDWPGLLANWSLADDKAQRTITHTNATLRLVIVFFVRNTAQSVMRIRVNQRPPADTFSFGTSIPAGVSMRLRRGGLEFVDDALSIVILRLRRWVAKDDNGVELGVSWRITGGTLFADLVKADWDAAAYPVVVN